MTSKAVRNRIGDPTTEWDNVKTARRTKGGSKLEVGRRMPRAGLSR
jgi:hypothetical protein